MSFRVFGRVLGVVFVLVVLIRVLGRGGKRRVREEV